MKRGVILVATLAFLLALPGCGGTSGKTPDEMTKTEFKTWLQMSKPELETWLTRGMGVTDLSLTEHGQGQFTGTGKKDGKPCKIKITRDTRQATWDIKCEGGNSNTGTRSGGISIRE
jgi:hypothetical protein